jgi:hypothetical protein
MKIQLKENEPLNKLIGFSLMFISTILTFFILVILLKSLSFILTSNTATGVIVGFQKVRISGQNGRSSTEYKSVIEFINHKDHKINFVSSTSHSRYKYDKTDEVKVYYNPDNSYNARLVNFEYLTGKQHWWLILFAIITGVSGMNVLFERKEE